jgi:hypothetical protein
MTSVWDDLRTQAHSELLVLLALADWANDDGYCWPTISALATKARLSERAVQQILGRLTTTGRIRRIQGGGRGRANRYQVVATRNGASETVNAIHRKEKLRSVTTGSLQLLRLRLAACQIARSASSRLRPGAEQGDGRGEARARFAALPLLW